MTEPDQSRFAEPDHSRFAAGAAYIDGRYMPVAEAAIP